MMMDVVYMWCNGSTFAQIADVAETFEGRPRIVRICVRNADLLNRFHVRVFSSTGSIIRCVRRLEELLREMCHAAKAIGNTPLENKFAKGIELIKRDIIFAGSLYL